MQAIDWHWREFSQLSNSELYEILKLRQDVFILEQQCFYHDLDNLDQVSHHLTGHRDGKLVAYLRIYPKQLDDQDRMFIGRVLTTESERGMGTGRIMMQQSLTYLANKFPSLPIQLSAQQYLTGFYTSLGFTAISEPYDEDGIMHLDMQLTVGE